MKRLILLICAASSLSAYIPYPLNAPAFHRTDFGSISFLYNQNIVAGLTNKDGQVMITADSSPVTAINSAIASWNSVTSTAAHFAAPQSTSLNYDSADLRHVITFTDDAVTRSITGGSLALTLTRSFSDGRIVDTDIYFNPSFTFSTTLAPGTFDIQSVLTHELGHALGSNHTNILAASMYFATGTQDTRQRNLTPDDVAFVSTTYPPPGGVAYGTITGATTVSGAPLLGGALTAVDPLTGVTIGGLSSIADGTFNLPVPPGNYLLYVEPAGSFNLYVDNTGISVFTSFQSAFFGGNAQPALFEVKSGATVQASINAAAGLSPLKVPFMAIGQAGATGDYRGVFVSGALSVSSGQAVDILFGSPTNGALEESGIQVLGPATLRPGSLRRDTGIGLSDGTPVYRFTLDVPPVAANTAASLIFRNGSDILTRSGVLILTRPQAVNAGSFLGGPVAPGEILSFFGSGLGPATPASNGGFDANGQLPGTLEGVTATFDTTPAPLFYVSDGQVNLQVPYEVSGKSQTVLSLTYNGTPVAKSTLTVAKSAPGIFVVTNVDGSVNGPFSPASVGDTLVIYGTGSGVTSGALRTGAAAPANSTVPANVTIGGQPVTPAFSGLTPGSVGLTQVNVVIPPGTAPGNAVPLEYAVNGSPTQTVHIAVR